MMMTLPTEDQLAIARSVATLLNDHFPLERFRAGTAKSDGWQHLVGIGILGISLPQADGGLGLSLIEETLVCRELGRNLLSPALIGHMLAPHVAARAGCVSLRDSLLRGNRCVGLAMPLSAAELLVIDGEAELSVLVESGLSVLVESERVRLVEIPADALRCLPCIDETVQLAAVDVQSGAVASVEGEDLVLAAHLLAAAMLCGMLEATRDMTAEYARERVQFGRPIGAFQAIKHRCADVALAAELCWAQTMHAANALAMGTEDMEFHVRAAKWLAGEEGLKATRFAIQAHGGMGFSAEVDAQLLMKRTHVMHQLFGDPRLVPRRLSNLPLLI
jgi:alkylation response protein AidB-like acyl-CoA dehydrogenase